jgi:predicted nucleic acid-binding protein
VPNGFGFLECALDLEAERIASGDSNLLELGSYMGIPILTPGSFWSRSGKRPKSNSAEKPVLISCISGRNAQ